MTENTSTTEKVPLFEMLPGEDQPILELVDTRRSFQAIAYYRDLAAQATADMGTFVAKLEAELDATKEFYARKVLAAEVRAEFYTKNLGNFAVQRGKTTVAAPLGTVFFKSTTKRTWPEDPQVLIDFAKAEGVAVQLIKIKESPNKPAFLKYIRATGAVPVDEAPLEVQTRQETPCGGLSARLLHLFLYPREDRRALVVSVTERRFAKKYRKCTASQCP